MAVLSYRNFDLLITRFDDAYRVHVVDAPGGDADATFALPFTWDELDFLADLSGARRGVIDQRSSGETPDLVELGSRLFGAIFQGKVAAVLAASQSQAEQEQAGLRLRLRFSQETSELATLPWEILYDPVQERFLALSESSPILRYLSLPKARPTLLVEPPLRVLAVLASPPGYEPLDLEREWQVLEAALDDLVANDTFVLERLESPTLAALQERLLGEAVHILHFVGHGGFDEDAGTGALVLADENGDAQEVPGRELATQLHNHSALRLVYLNACEGALSSHLTVFSGVAQTLVQQGVPAAVAMQAEITDKAAIELSRTFYTALARGYPVDAALTQARVAVFADDEWDWAAPVLFLRADDGNLFVEPTPVPATPHLTGAYNTSLLPHLPDDLARLIRQNRATELADILENLSHSVLTTVVGLGGVGKTILARVVVEDRPPGIPMPLWIDLLHEPELSLDDLLVKFADYLNWPSLLQFQDDNRSADRSDLVRLTGHLLEIEPVWIVFDNLESALDQNGRFRRQGLAGFFTALIGRTHNARILVTSRLLPQLPDSSPLWSRRLSPTVALEGLSQENGVTLLQQFFQLSGEAGLEQIVERVAGHPLALHVLAAEVQTWGVEELLATQTFWYESIESFADWLLSRLSSAEQQLLMRFSVFRRPQPVGVLVSLLDDSRAARRMVQQLLDRSLLEGYGNAGTRIFSLHPLVRELVQSHLPEEDRAQAHLAALEIYRGIELPPKHAWRGNDDIVPLLEAFHHAVAAKAVPVAAQVMLESGLPDLLERWGSHDRLIRMSQQLFDQLPIGLPADKALQQAGYLALKDQRLPPSRRAFLLRQLGKCARYLSRFPDAAALYQKGIDLLSIGEDDRELARLHRDSADTLNRLGEMLQALQRSQQGLALLRDVSDREGMVYKANLLMSSGNSLNHIGKPVEAFQVFHDAYRTYADLGLMSRAYQAYSNMGMALSLRGEIEGDRTFVQESLPYILDAMAFFRESGNLHGQAVTILNLASTYHDLEDYDLARNAYNEALNIFERLDYLTGKLITNYNLGELAFDEGQPAQALTYLQNALVYSRESGETAERPHVLYLLGKVECELGRQDDGEAHLRSALGIFEEQQHPLADEIRPLLETGHPNRVGRTGK